MTQDYINNNKERFLEELLEFIKIPSVSADMKFENDVLTDEYFPKPVNLLDGKNLNINLMKKYLLKH